MEDLYAAVDEIFEIEQVALLETLVNAPSHTGAKDDVEEAAKLLDEAAARVGLRRRLISDPTGRFADHRVYSTPATSDVDHALALVGHIDTVFPRSLGFLHFRREGDTVFGPGTLDMKSGLTEILFALAALRRARPLEFDRLKARFVCVSDEEVGSPSSASEVYAGLADRTSAALVFEAGRDEDRIVTARKGAAMYTVTARGRAAHAGNKHHEGANAIHALALVIPQIEGLTDYASGLTANVGLVEGGTAKNTVPDTARCVVDVRFERLVDVERVQAFFNALRENPFASVPPHLRHERLTEVRFEVQGVVSRPPMEASEATQRLRRRYETHAGAAGLRCGEAPLQGGGSDANLLAARGVPVIDGLGPAGKHFHKVEEHSSLDSLCRRTKALACFLAEEAQGNGSLA
ncbi:MAG: M20/M25/M40 family metallo-hydrolase [Myxococcota bacterium]